MTRDVGRGVEIWRARGTFFFGACQGPSMFLLDLQKRKFPWKLPSILVVSQSVVGIVAVRWIPGSKSGHVAFQA